MKTLFLFIFLLIGTIANTQKIEMSILLFNEIVFSNDPLIENIDAENFNYNSDLLFQSNFILDLDKKSLVIDSIIKFDVTFIEKNNSDEIKVTLKKIGDSNFGFFTNCIVFLKSKTVIFYDKNEDLSYGIYSFDDGMNNFIKIP